MKKTVKIIIGILILAAVSFLYGHIAKVHTIYDSKTDADFYGNTGILTDAGVRQVFTSDEEYLDGVRIMCSVIGQGADTVIQYELKDLETGETVAKGTEDGSDIENDKFHDFRFERVENCKGKTYEISLYSNKILGEKNEAGIGFYYENAMRQESSIVVADNRVPDAVVEEGTLVMKTITDRFDLETCVVFFIFALYVILFMRFLYKLFK